MKMQSMTGFSRAEAALSNCQWVWELKSVNGKNLDVRWRLPAGFDFLERELRSRLATKIARGNIQISLAIEQDSSQTLPRLNETVLDAVLDIIKRLGEKTAIAPPTAEAILSIKGVVEQDSAGEDEAQIAIRNQALLTSFDEAVSALADARKSEGSAIVAVLKDQIAGIERLTRAIIAEPSRSPDTIKAALAEKLSRLIDENSVLDPQRLHQEAAIMAVKADLQEELDRLTAHIDAVKNMLELQAPVGRKLDFLAQEFNRECNTICSKSNAASVTILGLEMKHIIDQFREQIQNLQ